MSTEPASRVVRLGDRVPNFMSRSTMGPVELAQYRGRWVILFSHPGDFTPVCTSEFLGLAKRAKDFDALDVQLLGLSVDSLYSHLAWVRLIKDHFGVEVRFPILDDPTLEIAHAFGMLPPQARDASSVRSTYFIDPEGIVRAITCYPYNVGRSVDEMVRIVTALSATQGSDRLAPEGWQAGEPLMKPPSADLDRVYKGESTDWFFGHKRGEER